MILERSNVFKPGMKWGMDIHESQQSWHYPLHQHRGFSEIIYVEKGELINTINGQEVLLKAGDLMIIHENDEHELKCKNMIYYNVNFIMDDLSQILKLMDCSLAQLPSENGHMSVVQVPIKKRTIWLHHLKTIFQLQQKMDANPKIITFLSHLCSEILFPPTFTQDHHHLPIWLRELIEKIQEAETIPRTSELPTLSQRSPEHISRSIQKHFSSTPSNYLNNIRLERATLLLTHTQKSILSIALIVGFNHLSYFNTQFKKTFGISPSQYRKNHHALPLSNR